MSGASLVGQPADSVLNTEAGEGLRPCDPEQPALMRAKIAGDGSRDARSSLHRPPPDSRRGDEAEVPEAVLVLRRGDAATLRTWVGVSNDWTSR